MGFGQPSGLPASAKQVQELLALLQAAGHRDFRDARGPMGFTQRQAGGRFSRDEAETFIEQLQDVAPVGDAAAAAATAGTVTPPATARAVRHIPAEQLAEELQRRGWIVIPP
jgi:hypothetical protein